MAKCVITIKDEERFVPGYGVRDGVVASMECGGTDRADGKPTLAQSVGRMTYDFLEIAVSAEPGMQLLKREEETFPQVQPRGGGQDGMDYPIVVKSSENPKLGC